MPEKLPISLCILCLNEAENLPRCLGRSEIFAEVLVLDTGSADRSIEVARNLGAKVKTSLWMGFSKTRKHHFQLATQPWILWLDADEELTPEFIEELHQLFSGQPSHSAYEINRLMAFEGHWIRHGDWFPDHVTRLFRADSWKMPEREIHESVEITGSIGKIHATVPHYSYRDWADRRKRVENYTTLWAEQQHHRGKKTSLSGPPLRAAWKLFRGLILKKGFLDGMIGWKIARSNAAEVYLKYHKLRKLHEPPSSDSH